MSVCRITEDVDLIYEIEDGTWYFQHYGERLYRCCSKHSYRTKAKAMKDYRSGKFEWSEWE